MSNVVADVEPDEFKLIQRETTSSFINKRRQIWITPQAQDTFAPNKNPVIEFILSSNSDIVNFPECEFHGTIKLLPELRGQMFDLGIGGVQNFFDRMVVSSVGSGRTIEQLQDYNFIAGFQTRLFMGKKMLRSLSRELRTCSFPGAGDQLEFFSFSPYLTRDDTKFETDITSTAAFKADATGAPIYFPVQTATNLGFTHISSLTFAKTASVVPFGIQELKPGDYIMLNLQPYNTNSGTLATTGSYIVKGELEYVDITDAAIIFHFRNYDLGPNQTPRGAWAATADTSVALVKIDVIRPHNQQTMNRLHKSDTNYNTVYSQDATAVENEIRFVFKPHLEIWKQALPLFLMKGIRIQLFLDRFERAFKLVKPFNLAATKTVNASSYELTNMRLHCVYITPSEAMKNRFTAQYSLIDNENLGLTYPMTFWKCIKHSVTTSATTHTFVINPGQRSVRAIFAVLSDNSIVGEFGDTALMNDSFQSWISSGTQRWYGMVGSERFPAQEVRNDWVKESRTAATSQNFGYPTEYYPQPQEAYKYLQDTLGATEIELLPYEEFCPGNKAYPISNALFPLHQRDSTGYVMAFDFSKSKGAGGALTGIDFTNTQFTMTLQKLTHSDGKWVSPTLTVHFYVMYDALVSISQRGIAVAD